MLLRLGLEAADRIVAALPSRVAYALADAAGAAWYRRGGKRRRLAEANLARVCAATGRPTSGREFAELVKAAFRNHARYYVELLRTPHYDARRIDRVVEVPQWAELEPIFRGGPSVIVTGHLGNFEPFATFFTAQGMRPMSPIEQIKPRELNDFLTARRGGRNVDLVPLGNARRALSEKLREGGIVGIIGDRDLTGGGQQVTMFGHPTTIPSGPAFLAVTHGATVTVGRCLRIGPDRFRGEGELIEVPNTGDRRADVAILTERIAARLEHDIGLAPEQWWGAFEPYWPDLRAEPAA